jgi:hypothetical protein
MRPAFCASGDETAGAKASRVCGHHLPSRDLYRRLASPNIPREITSGRPTITSHTCELNSHEAFMEHDKQLREQVAKVMDWNEAHADLSAAVSGFPPNCAGECRMDCPIPPGSCWNTCVSHCGTSWNSAAMQSTSPPNGLKATGRRKQLRPTMQRGRKASTQSGSIWKRCAD